MMKVLFVLSLSLMASTCAAYDSYDLTFGLEVTTKDTKVALPDACSEDEVISMFVAIEDAVADLGNQYLKDNNLPGSLENVVVSGPRDRRNLVVAEEQEQQQHRLLQDNPWWFNPYWFYNLAPVHGEIVASCAYCPPDIGDARRNLRMGDSLTLSGKKMVRSMNNGVNKRLDNAYKTLSKDCKKTGKWQATLTAP